MGEIYVICCMAHLAHNNSTRRTNCVINAYKHREENVILNILYCLTMITISYTKMKFFFKEYLIQN